MIAESIYPAAVAFETDHVRVRTRTRLTNEIARRYAPKIQRHASRYARRLPRHVAVADLVSAGYAGLVDAFMRFDTARIESFEAYVDHRIRGAILDELRTHDPLTRDQRTFARRMAAASQRLAAELGRAPTESDLAGALGMTLPALQAQLSRMNDTAARSRAGEYDEESVDAAPDECARPDRLAEQRERHDMLREGLDKLPPRQRDTLRMYYDEGLTLRQIAVRLGVTESRVSQIHSEAIARLRGLVSEACGED